MAGRTVWITGATSGIGRALAQQLVADGDRVIASARNAAALAALERAGGGAITALAFDITDTAAVAAMTARLKALGGIDTVIANAGTCEYIDVADFDAAAARRVIETNTIGTFNTVAAALPALSGPTPQVVLVSSLSTLVGLPRASAYGASKAAIDYLGRSLMIDLGGRGVDVTVVRPGFVKTSLTDRNDFAMPFIVEVEVAAARIAAGIRRRRRWVSFPARLVLALRIAWLLGPLWYRLAARLLARS